MKLGNSVLTILLDLASFGNHTVFFHSDPRLPIISASLSLTLTLSYLGPENTTKLSLISQRRWLHTSQR